jgi:hypothetical protein
MDFLTRKCRFRAFKSVSVKLVESLLQQSVETLELRVCVALVVTCLRDRRPDDRHGHHHHRLNQDLSFKCLNVLKYKPL